MKIRDIFVRKLICSGMMTGIGREANTKSVKILIAVECESAELVQEEGDNLTSVEEPNIPESFITEASRRRLQPQIHIPCRLDGETLEDTV
jgi:hypothetical protein